MQKGGAVEEFDTGMTGRKGMEGMIGLPILAVGGVTGGYGGSERRRKEARKRACSRGRFPVEPA